MSEAALSSQDESGSGHTPIVQEKEEATPAPMTVSGTLTETGTDLRIPGISAGIVDDSISITSLLQHWNILGFLTISADTTDEVICSFDVPTLIDNTSSYGTYTRVVEVGSGLTDYTFSMGCVNSKGTPSSAVTEFPQRTLLPSWSWAFHTAALYNGVPRLRFTAIIPPSITHQLEIRFDPWYLCSEMKASKIDSSQIQNFVEWSVGTQPQVIYEPPYSSVAGARPTTVSFGRPNLEVATQGDEQVIAGYSGYNQDTFHRGLRKWGRIVISQRTPYYRPAYLPNKYFVLIEVQWTNANFYHARGTTGTATMADYVDNNYDELDPWSVRSGADKMVPRFTFPEHPFDAAK